MPNCFDLTKKGEEAPMSLAKIDDEICAFLGVDPDPVKYHEGWFDSIGFKLATGKNFDQIVENFKEQLLQFPDDEWLLKMIKITEYLKDNFTSKAWVEIGRR